MRSLNHNIVQEAILTVNFCSFLSVFDYQSKTPRPNIRLPKVSRRAVSDPNREPRWEAEQVDFWSHMAFEPIQKQTTCTNKDSGYSATNLGGNIENLV